MVHAPTTGTWDASTKDQFVYLREDTIMSIKTDAIQLLDKAIAELGKSKGNLTSAVQQIHRAADLVEDKDLAVWCATQLGQEPYIGKTREIGAALLAFAADTKNGELEEKYRTVISEAAQLGIPDLELEEITIKTDQAGGGCVSISFVEDKYAEFVRRKKGNDGQYYSNNLLRHLTYVRTEAHKRAAKLLKNLRYSETPRTAFDVLREAVDDRLLDLDPGLAEQLMLAFQAVSSTKPEHWSQALTTCRRLIEGLADALYPPNDKIVAGRKVSKEHILIDCGHSWMMSFNLPLIRS